MGTPGGTNGATAKVPIDTGMPGRVFGAALSGREHRGVPGGLPGLPGGVPGPRIAGPYRGVPRRYRLVPTGEVPHE